MKDILRSIGTRIRLGCKHADVRFSHLETESISVKNGSVLGVDCHVDWELEFEFFMMELGDLPQIQT